VKNNILTKGRVMVVEDDAVLRETIVELLTENEWAVTWAIDGADAFSTFRSDPPDVILTDIVMPVCDGLELVKKIRQLDFDTPIVILTGYATYDHCVEALRAGANDFVPKPFESKELLDALARAILKRRDSLSADAAFSEIEYSIKCNLNRDNLDGIIQDVLILKSEAIARSAGFGSRKIAIRRTVEELLRYLSLTVKDDLRSITMELHFDHNECSVSLRSDKRIFNESDFTEKGNSENDASKSIFLLRTFGDEIELIDKGNGVTIKFFRPRPERTLRNGA